MRMGCAYIRRGLRNLPDNGTGMSLVTYAVSSPEVES